MSAFQGRPGGHASQDRTRQTTSRDAFYEGAAGGLTALIVDDNPINRFALTALLQRGGMTVLEAVDGAEALETVIHRPDIDIVLMDIMMPIMDGYETMAAIRQRPKFTDLPIIAVTAKETDGERKRCVAAGASDYIPKPIDAAELLEAISRWLPTQAASRIQRGQFPSAPHVPRRRPPSA
jgi:CheY-like chemotaxis protein